MRSLVVTNMYPSEVDPYAGLFVQREVEALRARGIEVEVLHIDTPSSAARYVTARPVVRDALRSNPDLVHVHFGLTQVVVPSTDLPRVITFHGSDLTEPWKRAISRSFARGAADLIVVAAHLREFVADLGTPISVIPAGVPSGVFGTIDRSEARSKLGLPPDATIALFPASPRRRVKRYELFERSVALVEGLVPVTLDDVAPGDVPDFLAAADVVVLTSLREGSPVVTKEALCSGTRVVAVPVGDVEWQLAGMSGCAVAAESTAEAVSGAIREALELPPPDARSAEARFEIAGEADAVMAVYESVLHG